jgi:branched-chain amino acid transport system permease protein
MSIHHVAAELDPFRWMFTIGGMLIAVVLIMPGGIVNSLGQLKARLSRKRAAHG